MYNYKDLCHKYELAQAKIRELEAEKLKLNNSISDYQLCIHDLHVKNEKLYNMLDLEDQKLVNNYM